MSNISTVYLWKKAPFLRLLPPFVCGIAYAYLFSPGFVTALLLLFVVFIFAILFESVDALHKYPVQRLSGLPGMCMLFLMGIVLFLAHDITRRKDWFGHHLSQATALKAVVTARPQMRAHTYKITAEVQAFLHSDSLVPAHGRVLLYFSPDSAAINLAPGDVILVKNKMQRIKNRGNPGEFDFEKYMAFQSIYHQAFLRAGDWQGTGENQLSFLEKAVLAALAYSHDAFESHMSNEREIALAKALLTGDRSALDRSLVDAYANTGVIHIMAISGLHLGLVYIFLVKLCLLIPGLRKNNLGRFVVVITGIWFFTFMTGCSPSVMRAAVMFSFLTLGILTRQKVKTYNFWAAAAFILLCFNPLLLFHVGFQLSFLAVLGILVVQKPIYDWLRFHNKGVDYIWQLISVTLAAQIFTLPLCLYYFHQFPLLFILANLIAIPLASAGLWMGMILLIVSCVPGLSTVAGYLAETAFRWMNQYISYINGFRFSVWDGFLPNVPETFVLSLLIVFLLLWLMKKHMLSFRLMMVCMIALSASSALRAINRQTLKTAIVYNIPYATAIDFISSGRYSHSAFAFPGQSAPAGENRAITTAREFLNARDSGTTISKTMLGENELYSGKKLLLHLKRPQRFGVPEKKIRMDAILLSGSPRIQIADLHRTFDAELYIFAPSNKRYQIEKWKKECEELLLRSHDITEAGALVFNY